MGFLTPRIPTAPTIEQAPAPTIAPTDTTAEEEQTRIAEAQRRIVRESERIGVSALRIPRSPGSGTGLSIHNG